MTRALAPLLACLLLASLPSGPALAADDPPFSAEAFATVSWGDADTDRVEVVVNGVPASGFSLTGESSGPGLSVGGTWYACGVEDDGAAPRALLPLLSRTSFAAATASLSSDRRRSDGTATGQAVKVTSSLSGDGSVTGVSAGGGWYLGRATALLLGLGYGRERRTDGTRLEESPSVRSEVGRVERRRADGRLAAGALRWLGEDLLVTAEGEWTFSDARRSDEVLFSAGSGTFSQETEADGDGWGVRLGARALLLGRRLVLDASGRYGESREDGRVLAPEERPYSETRTIAREASLGATWYPSRVVGLGLSAGYRSESLAAGLQSLLRAGSVDRVPVGLSVTWFPAPRAFLALAAEATFTEGTYPPDAATYERYEGRALRFALSGGLRF